MQHQVGVGGVLVAADEAARLEVVAGPWPLPAEQPQQRHPGAVPVLEVGRDRDRLRARVLHVHLQVVLEVLADAWQVLYHVDAEGFQLVGVAHARKLERLGRVDRAAAEDHLAGMHGGRRPSGTPVLHADRARAVEEDPRDQRPRSDPEVRPAEDRVQVGAGRRQAPALVDVAVEGREALLPVAVYVVGELVPRLLHRLEERIEQRAGSRAALQHERSGVAAVDVRWVRGQARLHPLEVGQAVGVVPRLHAGIGGPALVVHRVAALEDHAVDAAGASEHLAARVVDPSPVQVWLGLGAVPPVVEPDCRSGTRGPPACG